MNSRTFQTSSEEEMIALGEHIATLLPAKAVVFLSGDLGAGKTTLTKGIAKGLGAAEPDEVSSPTFTLIHEYGSPNRLYHIDLYRIETARQLASLGLDELFDRSAVVVIEWAEKFSRWLPENPIIVRIDSYGESRTVTITQAGA